MTASVVALLGAADASRRKINGFLATYVHAQEHVKSILGELDQIKFFLGKINGDHLGRRPRDEVRRLRFLFKGCKSTIHRIEDIIEGRIVNREGVMREDNVGSRSYWTLVAPQVRRLKERLARHKQDLSQLMGAVAW